MTAGRSPAATVLAYLDALNHHNADDVVSCVDEEFVNEHTSTLGVSVVGRRAYRERLAQFLAEFPELHYEPERVIEDGSQVAVPYRMTGNWRAPGAESSATRPFSIRGMFRFEVRQGLITHRADYWDSADFLRQVRVAEASAQSWPEEF